VNSGEARTGTTSGARDHARAQAGTVAVGMPTVPAPDGTIWEETLDAGEYTTHRLPRGAILRLTDLAGDACAHLVVHNARVPAERLNLADTTKVQWQMYPSVGSMLLSDMGRVLMTIVGDTSTRHDTVCGAPNRAAHEAKYGDGRVEGRFPNARDRLIVALAKQGLQRRDLPPSISFFKGVRVDEDGSLRLDPSPATAGAFVELQAELDVIVSLANVPHVLDPRSNYVCTPLRLTARPAEVDRAASTPEAARAYANTDEWLLAR
jgi:urea carboxylase-associated protein 2